MTIPPQQLLADIEKSRKALLKALENLSENIAKFQLSPDRWSIVQYVEHLVRAEEATFWRMWLAVDAFRGGEEFVANPTADLPIEEVVARTWREKEKAPPLAVPELGGSLGYWSVRFERNQAIAKSFAHYVRKEELYRLWYPHPISGPFSLRQGMEFVRFHIDRHFVHIQDIQDGFRGSK